MEQCLDICVKYDGNSSVANNSCVAASWAFQGGMIGTCIIKSQIGKFTYEDDLESALLLTN
jgi:hypothetical protein